MQNAVLHVKIPFSVQKDFSEKKILASLIQEALAKKEYYAGHEHYFSEKYSASFPKFAAKVKKTKKENLEWWDDLMEWEACHLAGKEWNQKYKDLLRCWKSSKT